MTTTQEWLAVLYNRLGNIEGTRLTLQKEIQNALRHLNQSPANIPTIVLNDELTKAGCHARYVRDFSNKAKEEHRKLVVQQSFIESQDTETENSRDTESVFNGIAQQIQEAMASLNTGDHAVIVVRKESSEETVD